MRLEGYGIGKCAYCGEGFEPKQRIVQVGGPRSKTFAEFGDDDYYGELYLRPAHASCADADPGIDAGHSVVDQITAMREPS